MIRVSDLTPRNLLSKQHCGGSAKTASDRSMYITVGDSSVPGKSVSNMGATPTLMTCHIEIHRIL